MKVENIPINKIKPYERNAKKHDETQIKNVMESIKQFGIVQPMVVDKNNVLIIGHCRLIACKRMRIQEVPIVRKEELSEEEANKLRLLDNKLNESDWDFDLLAEDIPGLDFGGFDLDWNLPDIEEDTKEIVEDEVPEIEENEEPEAKLGDIYQLGRHRLICGDSTDAETIKKLVGNEKIDLLLTDPPYNVNLGSIPTPTNSNIVPIQNDSMEESKFIEFLTKALKNGESVMKPGAAYYIFYAGLHHIEFESAIRNIEEFKLHEQLIWVKSHFVLGRNSDYQWMHEPCLYGWKQGAAHFFTDSRSEGTVIEDSDVKLSTLKKDELIALCEKWMGINKSTTILRANRPMSADLHPTVKPQELLTTLMRNSSQKNWNVLDLFGGSGSTLIASEQLERNCFMCELEPHYVDVIIKRWEEFTGEKAVKLNG